MDKRLWRFIDWPLIIGVLAIEGLGLIAVGSATRTDGLTFVYRQGVFIVAGWALAAGVAMFDYAGWRRYAKAAYWLSILVLATVAVAGHVAGGAQRWLEIGPVALQPSEFAKLAFILSLAWLLSRKQTFETTYDFIEPLLFAALPAGLVMLQPDLGTALVFVAVLGGMMFMGGAPLKPLLTVFGGGFAAMVVAFWAHLQYGLPLPLKDYQIKRLLIFLNPESDPLGHGWQIIQSKIAIGNGALFGKGLFAGSQNQLQFLPEQHTDFIFAVIGEEFGFVGSVLLLGLFLFVLWRGIHIATRAKDRFGLLLASGVVAMLFFHIFVNVGMAVSLMPVTGIPLPFVSYGGSALLTNSLAIGVLQNIHMRRHRILF